MTISNAADGNHQNGHQKMSQDHRTPEEIQLEIARTRSAITEDLRVLSERFSPQQLKESAREVIHEARVEAKELMRDAKEVAFGSLIGMKDRAVESVSEGVGLLGNRVNELGVRAKEAGGLTVQYMSNHALLLSLVGAGAGWLLMALRNYRRVQSGQHDYQYEHYSYPTDAQARHPERPYEGGVRGAASLATRTADEARERVRSVTYSATEAAERARERVRARAANRRGVREIASDNRGTVVALTIAAGLGIGLLLPVGRKPRRALLGAGERVWDGAQAVAHDVAARTRDVAARARAAI